MLRYRKSYIRMSFDESRAILITTAFYVALKTVYGRSSLKLASMRCVVAGWLELSAAGSGGRVVMVLIHGLR